MPTLAESLVSSSARALPLRKRPDLSARQHRYQGRLYWVVKDPVALQYFRFQEEEYAILNMLDGRTSLDDLKARFEKQFPPQKITVEELGQFVGMLHRSSLIIANVPGQGKQLKERRDKRKRKEMLGLLTNILAIRFKGIDPDKLLNWLQPKVSWFFSKPAAIITILYFLAALTLVLVQFDVFRAKLPTFEQFFTKENWIFLGATLALTKVLHEFGHGLSCKHFGGECHEMGVMLLVLTPCLYCNVSDSWMLPNKWHRAFIGAAGMYVELVIASTCTFVWWFTEPGLLNNLCLSTMFVCSVSTVMFNANPLLRYDGYYILSDITEIPNLRQKASAILARKLNKWCLGLKEPEDPFLPQRNQAFFALYSVAAAIYRWVVLFSILWFLYNVFEPYGLKVISQMITIVSVAGLVIQPLWKVGKFFYIPGRLQQVKKKNLRITLAVLAAVGAFVFFVPLPYRIVCTLEVKPQNAQSVYVAVPGELTQISVKPGDKVAANQQLGKLNSIELLLQIEDLKGKLAAYQAKVISLERLRFTDRVAGQDLAQTQKTLQMYEEQIKEKERDLDRLVLRAPIGGTVIPPPAIPPRPERDGELATFSGIPLREANLGAHLPESTLFCQIGDPQKMEALLVVDQDEIEFMAEGQDVDIKLDELPGTTYHTSIEEIAKADLKVAPRQLSNKGGGEVATRTDESGTDRPINTSYQVRADLDNADGLLFVGLRGHAKVHARWQTLWTRGVRLFMRTFNFKL